MDGQPTAENSSHDGSKSGVHVDPNTWLEQHGDSLYAYALSKLKNPELAEEAVQDTFLGALKNVATFKQTGVEGAWLMGILKKKVVDKIRSRSVGASNLQSDEMLLDRLFDQRGNWSEFAKKSGSLRLDAVEQSEFRELLAQCLDGLPAKQAAAFTLKEVKESPNDVVCKELDITPNNLWVLMHRARLRLAECIKARWAMGDE